MYFWSWQRSKQIEKNYYNLNPIYLIKGINNSIKNLIKNYKIVTNNFPILDIFFFFKKFTHYIDRNKYNNIIDYNNLFHDMVQDYNFKYLICIGAINSKKGLNLVILKVFNNPMIYDSLGNNDKY